MPALFLTAAKFLGRLGLRMRACVHHIGNAADFTAAPQYNAHF
jgi:hypothetical protein